MKGKGGWRLYILLAVGLVAAGYVSNALSRSACQENAAFWFSHVLLAGNPFHLRLDADQEGERRALDAVGARYTLLGADPGPDAYPRVNGTTDSQIPFMVSVRFQTEHGARQQVGCNRTGFTAHYLCVFGLIFSLGDSFDFEN
jgi:hypothetical protein